MVEEFCLNTSGSSGAPMARLCFFCLICIFLYIYRKIASIYLKNFKVCMVDKSSSILVIQSLDIQYTT